MPGYLSIIIGIVFTILYGITSYLFAQKDKRQEKCLDWLKEKARLQELKIQHLEDKLWSEEKLTGVIVNAVALAMTNWENQMLKSGFIHNHTRKEDKKGDHE